MKHRLSPLETMFLELFKAVGIPVVPQYAIDIFNVDFAIPDAKLAIEIDGGNWHIDHPRKIAQDTKKQSFLTEAQWTILRFDGYRIKPSDALAFVHQVSCALNIS